jgi:hypothetical protein
MFDFRLRAHIPKPAEPEPNRDFERAPPSAVRAILDDLPLHIRPESSRSAGANLTKPNGFEPLRRVHDRIIRVLWPINFAHKRQRVRS